MTGSSPSSVWRNSNCGTYRPSTTMHTVSGIDSSSPTPPHSHVQKLAATITATGDSPVLDP